MLGFVGSNASRHDIDGSRTVHSSMMKSIMIAPDRGRVLLPDVGLEKQHDDKSTIGNNEEKADPAFVPRTYEILEGEELERHRTPSQLDDESYTNNNSTKTIENSKAEYATATIERRYETAVIDNICLNPETSIPERVPLAHESEELRPNELQELETRYINEQSNISIPGQTKIAERSAAPENASQYTNHERSGLEDDKASIVSVDSLDRELLDFHILEANEFLEGSEWGAAEKCISKLLKNRLLRKDERLNWSFKLAEAHGRTENWQMLLDLIKKQGLDSCVLDHLAAEAHLNLGNPKEASKYCLKAIKIKRKESKSRHTLNDSMELMARIMDQLGNDIEARFYRSKLPCGFVSSRESRLKKTRRNMERDEALRMSNKILKPYNLSFDIANTTLIGVDRDIIRAWRKAMKHNLKDMTSVLLLDVPRLYSASLTGDDISPLHMAVRFNRNDAIPQLVGQAALHEAIIETQLDLVQLLITSGASLQSTDKEGWTLLHVASRFSSPGITKLLLDYGADVCATTNESSTPLHLALENDNSQWSLEITMLLISRRSKINAVDDHGWTPLHCAARFGTEGITRYLTDAGADVSALTNIGSTPLHMAIRNPKHSVAIAKLLSSRGSPLDQRNHDGMTPLQIATRHSTWELVLCLDELGANTFVKTNSGRTLLHLAVYNKREPVMIIRLLLLWGLHIDEPDDQYWTPLHIAARSGTPAVVQCLLQHRADVQALTKLSLETPLHMVAHRKDEAVAEQIARLLIENGAEIDAEDENGDTPLRFARTWRRKGLERVFKEHGAKLKQSRIQRSNFC